MATARTLSPTLPLSTTWRQFQAAVLLALLVVGAGGVIYLVETFALGLRHRFVENPAEAMVRAFGIAHFGIGWLFLISSPRLRCRPALARVAVLTILGAAWCVFSWANGGLKNPLLLLTFYAYFLVHEIRDEANLFVAYGDAPDDPARDVFLRRLGTTVALALMTVFALIYMFHGRVQEKLERIVAEPDRWLPLLGGGLLVGCLASAWTTWSWQRRHGIALRDFAPLLAVYATIGSILAVGSLLGSVGFNLIVLIHVMAWLVFVRHRLASTGHAPLQRRGVGVAGLWTWLRTTPAGLVTLHLVAAGIVLVLMALRVHLWQRAGLVSELFATSSFQYWTIMHITIAFWRK